MIRTFIAALLVFCILPTAAAFPSQSINDRIGAQRKRADRIHRRLSEKRSQLRAATVKVGNLRTQLDATDAAIAQVNRELGDLAARRNGTLRRLAWNTLQLDAAKRSLALHDNLLKKRLVDIYERGNLGYIDVLLAARSFSDFVERWEDLRLLIAANENAIRTRKATEARVAQAQARLEATRLSLQQQAQARRQAKNQLAMLADERSNLVALADAQRRHVAGQVAQMEALSASEEAELERLIVEREREVAAQQQAARRAAGIAGSPPPPTGAPGKLIWPVSGIITSPFGWRKNPFGGAPEFHQGLDIGAPMGTTVVAAAAGTVISAGWFGGYGNYILIDNGGALATGYAHLSQIFVADGQRVQQGQAIGAVGSTGYSTGPHLHFEVRIHGKPVDPTPYLH